jgi:hypothetical protein
LDNTSFQCAVNNRYLSATGYLTVLYTVSQSSTSGVPITRSTTVTLSQLSIGLWTHSPLILYIISVTSNNNYVGILYTSSSSLTIRASPSTTGMNNYVQCYDCDNPRINACIDGPNLLAISTHHRY